MAPSKKNPQYRAGQTRQRKGWEGKNPERFQGLSESLGQKWASDPELQDKFKKAGLDPGQETDAAVRSVDKMGPGKTYRAMGWTEHDSGELPGQGTLFKDDRLMDNPARWEDLPKKSQDRIKQQAANYGVSEASATHAFATQLDRAHVREDGKHASFYSEEGTSDSGAMLPRTRLKESAKANGVDFHVQAAANAITSPNNRFVRGGKDGGPPVYPNDDAATAAIKWSQAGGTGEEYINHPEYKVPEEDKVPHPKTGKPVKKKGETRKYPNMGYPEQAGKAIDVTTALRNGAPLREAWKPEKADKVKPYYNAWVDPKSPEGNFHVSDTHSGAAAFAPHIANTEREDAYLGIQGIHAYHDHIARKVLHERGLTQVSRHQSAQWSQEKEEQGHGADVGDMVRTSKKQSAPEEVPGQQALFSRVPPTASKKGSRGDEFSAGTA
jgi:hypothetical protein